MVFNYIKLGNCDVRILWLDPLLQQLVGLLYRILVNKDLFLYLIYPVLCFVSIYFFQVTALNLEVVRALARGTNLVVTIQILCMFSPNSTYPQKKKKCFLLVLYFIYLHIFLSIKSRSVMQVKVCLSKVKECHTYFFISILCSWQFYHNQVSNLTNHVTSFHIVLVAKLLSLRICQLVIVSYCLIICNSLFLAIFCSSLILFFEGR